MIYLEKQERMPWIDALKGVGMLAVVAGHILPAPTHTLVYTFHMPLFFLVSGYLFRPKGINRLTELVRKIFFPAIASVLVIFLVFWMAPAALSGTPITLSSLKAFRGQGNFVILWFPVVLMIDLIAMEVIEKIRTRVTQAMIVALLFLASYANDGFRLVDTPLSTAVSTYSLAFVFLGRFAASTRLKVHPALIAVTALSVGFSPIIPSLAYDFFRGDLGIPIVSFVNSALITLGLAAAIKMIQSRYSLSYIMAFGRTSFFTMMFHQPIQIALLQQGLTNFAVRFLAVVLICAFLAFVVEKVPVLRAIFLGGGAKGPRRQV